MTDREKSRKWRPSPPMTRNQVLQALIDARALLDGVVMNQEWGLRMSEDAVVTSDQCLRLDKLARDIVAVGYEIDADGATAD